MRYLLLLFCLPVYAQTFPMSPAPNKPSIALPAPTGMMPGMLPAPSGPMPGMQQTSRTAIVPQPQIVNPAPVFPLIAIPTCR